MASGLPDYQVEYKLTTGGVLEAHQAIIIPGIGTHDMFNIAGKGIIIGGNLRITGSVMSQRASYFDVTVDDNIMRTESFEHLNDWGLDQMYSSFLYELFYDDVNFVYTVGFPNMVTFESSVVVEFSTLAGGCTTAYDFLYSLFV